MFISLTSLAQQIEVKECSLQDLGNNTGIVSITFKGDVIHEFTEVKMSVQGSNIEKGEFTFVVNNPVVSGKKNQFVTLTGKVKLSSQIDQNATITYEIMNNGIKGFKELKSGSVNYISSVQK